MSSFPSPDGRRSKRVMLKGRASLVVNLDATRKASPVSSSIPRRKVTGYAGFHLRRGQFIEIVFDPEPFRSVRCRVVWVGKAGSKQEAEAGLEMV